MKPATVCAFIGLFTLCPLYQKICLSQWTSVHSIGIAIKIRVLKTVREYIHKARGQAVYTPQAGYVNFISMFAIVDFACFRSSGYFVLDLKLGGNHRQGFKNFIGHFSPPVREIAGAYAPLVCQTGL
jgi:hypothetical protein